MRLSIAALAGALALAAGSAQAAAVEVKDAIVQVTVIPETRSDIRVEVLSTHPRLPLKIRIARDRTIIDGAVNGARIRSCRGGADPSVRVAGIGEIALKDMPRIVVRTPRDVDVSVGGAVFGAIGRAVSVNLGNAGCGDWTVANVEGRLRISQAGSGDARAGASSEARLRTTGSGDIAVGDVHGRLDIDVAGSGDVSARSVAGPLDVHVAGSGDVRIAAGEAPAMVASVAGSGNVEFRGVAGRLDARIAGSGDVRARQVRGPVKKTVIGSGAVRIG